MNRNKADKEFALGKLLIAGQQSSYSVLVDRAAVAFAPRGYLYFVSAIGVDSALKGLRATLAGTRSGMTLCFREIGEFTAGDALRDASRERILVPEGKFRVHHQKLKYGLIHAMYVSRDEDFLLNVGAESLWRALNAPRYTTPLLRHWMPWIIRRLQDDRKLKLIHSYRCTCGLLRLTNEELDHLVTQGVRSGALTFEESPQRSA